MDLSKIPRHPERQDALTDQLEDLVMVATRFGMYDAAVWVRMHLDKPTKK